MKTLTVPIPDFNHTLPRVVVLGIAIAGLGLATWYGTRPLPADNDRSFVEGPPGTSPNGYDNQTRPVVYRDRAATDGQCSQWDVSPLAMEAILQEMLRRGWKPPTQGEAIASIAPMNGPQMTAVDPNAPLAVFPRSAPPVDPGAPEEGVVTDDPNLTATEPAMTTPATRPPAALPSRPPAAQPPAATPPRTAPPAATSPRPPSAQPPVPPRPAPATPPVATPPAAAPTAPSAEPAAPADPV